MHPLMPAFLGAAGALVLGGLGLICGRWIASQPVKRRNRFYVIETIAVWILVVPIRFPELETSLPFSFLFYGRTEYLLYAFLVPCLGVSVLPMFPTAFVRRFLMIGLAVGFAYSGLWTQLAVVLTWRDLAERNPALDGEVYKQSTGYSCGSAAGINWLRLLGSDADERLLAATAGTSVAIGTPTESLMRGIERHSHFDVRAMHVQSVAELKDHLPALAIVNLSFMLNHWVVISEIEDGVVVRVDPLNDVPMTQTISAFDAEFTGEAIVLAGEK